MNQSSNPPMQQALNKPKDSSSDVETWYRELVRERALHDEATLIQAAEQRGEQRGKQEGLQDALIKMVASGFPEAQARSILGL
jgi:predicted transposase YdaD